MSKNDLPRGLDFNNRNQASISSIIQYTLPVLRENKNAWYIEFYAYDPLPGKMRRKRIKINRIKNIRARRQYARDIINRLVQQLMQGWNPWIAQDFDGMTLFNDAINRYANRIIRMYEDGLYRKIRSTTTVAIFKKSSTTIIQGFSRYTICIRWI